MGCVRKIGSIVVVGVVAILILLGAASPAPAQAGDQLGPVAIIVSLADGSSRDRAFEFLKQGTVLKLGAGGTAVIGYFKSCVQEAIESGVVTIGETQSDIRGGIVTREQVECDGSKLVLTPEQLAASAVTVNRGPEGTAATSVVTLYSTKPYIMLKDPSTTVVIRRVDVAGEPLAIETVKISSSPRSASRKTVAARQCVSCHSGQCVARTAHRPQRASRCGTALVKNATSLNL